MKLQNKWFIGAMLGAAVCLVSTSCVDEIKFGNSFLDKAPGGNATIDTVFNSAEYTRQFLNTCYSRQYYGLPYNTDSNGNIPDSSSPYLGKKDALTDCWSLYFSDATVYQQYYLGSLNANYGTRGNIFPYTREMVWEVVRWCWLLRENIDRVPGMDNAENRRLQAAGRDPGRGMGGPEERHDGYFRGADGQRPRAHRATGVGLGRNLTVVLPSVGGDGA